MSQLEAYKKKTASDKEKLSKRLLPILFLHRVAKLWTGANPTTQQIIQLCGEETILCADVMNTWLKWKATLPAKEKRRDIKWLKFFSDECGIIFSSFAKYKCTPDAVKDVVRIYLNALKPLYWETALGDPDRSCPITRNDWEKLENATTAVFFGEWLESQQNMRQSIYGFTKAPFGEPIPESKLEEQDENGVCFLDTRYKRLVDAFEELDIMLEMGLYQEEIEAFYKPHSTKQGFHMHPYTHLCAIELIMDSKVLASKEYKQKPNPDRDTSCFRIFKYISQRQNVFQTPSDKSSNLKIARACLDYAKVLDKIAKWGYPTNSGEMLDAKRYVIGSMMVMELEEAYRLHFVSAAASVAQEKKRRGTVADCRAQESEIAQCILERIPSRRIPFYMVERDYKLNEYISFPAHNILNYERDLKFIYSEPIKLSSIYVLKTTLLRDVQIELMVILKGIFSLHMKMVWSDSDFQSVAKFLKEEYNVVDTLREIGFPKPGNSQIEKENCRQHYTRMRKVYEMIQSWEINGGNRAYSIYRHTMNTLKPKKTKKKK